MEHLEQQRFSHEASQVVRLTRFSSLDSKLPDNSTQDETKPDHQQLAHMNQFQESPSGAKWPWSRRELPAKSQLDVADCETGSAAKKAPFQVIWSQLAFEVNTRTYDQLLGGALTRTRSFLAGPNRSDQHQLGGETKPTKLPDPSSSGSRRVIFENLNGHINSGEISAILGPSGAGKTSLINAICSRANSANYRGRVQLLGASSSRMRVSVIPQKDHLLERLSVQENLLFASRILNPDRGFDHQTNILCLAKMLNLLQCLGSSTASISGGEYKRLSIAQELLKRPDILVLDEPTSGLDSVNCKNLIRSLRSLIEASRRGTINPIAIVLTIHQPDVEIFHMFDHIYCMARAGRTIFEGPPSKALEVIRSQSGISADLCQLAVNPANLLIEIASEFVHGPAPIERLNRFQLKQFEHQHHRLDATAGSALMAASWPSMLNHMVAGARLTDGKSGSLLGQPQPASTSPSPSSFSVSSISTESSSAPSSVSVSAPAPAPASVGATTQSCTTIESLRQQKGFLRDKRLSSKVDHSGKFWRQMALLTRRNFTADIRDPLMTGAAIVFHLMIPLVMWVAYSRRIGAAKACPLVHREMELLALAANETAAKLLEQQEEFAVALECSTMFFLTSYCFSLRSLSMAALSFPLSMHVLVKESRNGWYNVPAYVAAKLISSLLTEVLLPVISVIIIYKILDMPDAAHNWRLWAVALVMALVSLISTVQGLIWGAISMDSVQTSIFMASASSLPLVMLSGFTARIKQMPLALQHLSWLSLYRYSSDTINMIRFGFGLCACDQQMDDYLRTRSATFTDMPDRMKPLFTFYLGNGAGAGADEDALAAPTADNSTLVAGRIAGISYDLVLNATVRNDMLRRLEANEFDLFGKMAELLAKSFTYGREITGCHSMRSQLLLVSGVPDDQYLSAYLAGLATMLVLVNIILFLLVKTKVTYTTKTRSRPAPLFGGWFSATTTTTTTAL